MNLIKYALTVIMLLSFKEAGYSFIKKEDVYKNKFKSKVKNAKFAEDVFLTKDIILKIPVTEDNGMVWSIFITKSGKILVNYFHSKNVLYFNESGELIKVIGREGLGPGEFKRPWYINEIGDKIIIGDFLTFRISLFDKNGNFIRSINLHHPINSLSVVNNNLFAVDDYLDAKWKKRHDIYVYNLNGKLISKFGELSYAGKELRKIPYRSQGPNVTNIGNNIYETDCCDYVIRKYDFKGNLIKVFGEKPEGWKSLLTTPYKGLDPSMGWSALDKYWPKFHKCSTLEWICGTNSGYLISLSLITDKNKMSERIVVYNKYDKLIYSDLLIKTLYSLSLKRKNIGLRPITGKGFGLWIYPEQKNEILSNKKDVEIKIKLRIFYLK